MEEYRGEVSFINEEYCLGVNELLVERIPTYLGE